MEEINICTSCPRHCKVDRKTCVGFCNENDGIRIAKIIENFMWEEPCVTGDKGALAIFFSGCNLKCSYCQNYEISCGQVGRVYSETEFINLLKEKSKDHSCIDLVTPTHFSKQLLDVFSKYKPEIPVVWNSSSYEDLDLFDDIFDVVDVFLMDFKYASNSLSQKYSNCNNYFDIASKILERCNKKADILTDSGFMKQGFIIRHLVLPGEVENSIAVLKYISNHFKDRKISVMSQFTPNKKGKPDKFLTPLEYKIILNKLEEYDLNNGYIQDFSSADDCFVPDFSNKKC